MYKIMLLCGTIGIVLTANGQTITRLQLDSLARSIDPARKDTQQIFSFLKMAEFHIDKAGEIPADLDSANKCIENAERINKYTKSKLAEGYILLVQSLLARETPGGASAGKEKNRQAIALLRQTDRYPMLGKALVALSWYEDYRIPENLAVKIDCLSAALDCFKKAGDNLQQGNCLEQLADLYLNQGNFPKAEQCGIAAIQCFRRAGNPAVQGVCIALASSYSRELDYRSAMKYALMALDALGQMHDESRQVCRINNTIAVLYGKMENWEKCLAYFQVAVDWARKHHDMDAIYLLEESMVGAYIRSNQPKKAIALVEYNERTYGTPPEASEKLAFFRDHTLSYSFDGQFDKAKIWCGRMTAIVPPTFTDSISAIDGLMKFYILSRQYHAAALLEPGLRRMMKNLPDSGSVAQIYGWLFRLDTGRHQYASAVQDHLHHDRLRDSIFDITRMRQIERLQLDYATAEKEHSIKLLEKETEIQKKDLSRSNQTRNYAIAGAFFVLLTGYGRYHLKQRQNRQLIQKQNEISAKNRQLEKLLRENEWLLREVHHRVKNNLQIVTSLLGSQSARLQENEAFNAVTESQHRIQSMALIHQKLYRSENFSTVNMEEYISDLVDYLRDSVHPGQAISFVTRIERISLDVSQAVPVGLILNEAITNSIKYAFPEGTCGRISIKFVRRPDGLLFLRISDNGTGLPAEFAPKESTGFGMRLIHGLAEDLEADVEVASDEGMTWVFAFQQLTPNNAAAG